MAPPSAGYRSGYFARVYALYGALFGLLFPVGSTLLRAWTVEHSLSFHSLGRAQTDPLLWIIDSAPFWLGLFASFAGRRQDRLAKTYAELQERHQQLAHVNAELERAAAVKTQFLANMSHELRTPLNAIIGFTKIILRKAGDSLTPKHQRQLGLVQESGEHLLQLVNDLLDIERIEAGMINVNRSDVECMQLVKDIVTRFRPTAAEKGLTLVSEGDAGPLVMNTDAVRLRQVLDNLVTNAVKYSDSGTVTLRVRERDGSIEFTVQDEGQGIPADQMQSIFEPFHQVDSSSTRASGGVGLGLHLVQRLCTVLGGTIVAESELGVGSTFTVVLPQGDARPRRAAERVEARGKGPRILVIDDDIEAVEIMQAELVDAGFEVHAAHDGETGLKLAAELAPQAIVLDIVMPELDGWAVLKQLRSDPDLSSIPVVIVSVLDEAPKAINLGIVAWLTKPISGEEFRRVVAAAGVSARDEVLVVEDDGPTMELIQESLAELKVLVREASTGGKAVARLEMRLPSLVILDLTLPDFDGFEVLHRLRAMPGGGAVPVIVYTGRDLNDEDRKRLNGGLVEIIRKDGGNSLENVSQAVRRVLDGGRA